MKHGMPINTEGTPTSKVVRGEFNQIRNTPKGTVAGKMPGGKKKG